MRLTHAIALIAIAVLVPFILLLLATLYLRISFLDILIALVAALLAFVQFGYNAMPSLYVSFKKECKKIDYEGDNFFHIPYIGPNSRVRIKLTCEDKPTYLIVGNAGPGVASRVDCEVERKAEHGSYIIKLRFYPQIGIFLRLDTEYVFDSFGNIISHDGKSVRKSNSLGAAI